MAEDNHSPSSSESASASDEESHMKPTLKEEPSDAKGRLIDYVRVGLMLYLITAAAVLGYFSWDLVSRQAGASLHDADVLCAVTVVIFVMGAVFFFFYDRSVRKHQATEVGAIVNAMSPVAIEEQSLAMEEAQAPAKEVSSTPEPAKGGVHTETKEALMKYVTGDAKPEVGSKPIAELFPEATVLFADISGFTAWSSIREPSQVFTLLETIFGCFDTIAVEKGVFKVETVGDCYVAVCGLPEPNKDQ